MLNNYFKFKYMIWYYFKKKLYLKFSLKEQHVQPLLVYI